MGNERRSMAALVEVLKAEGVEVADQYESDGREESPYSSVVFGFDEIVACDAEVQVLMKKSDGAGE